MCFSKKQKTTASTTSTNTLSDWSKDEFENQRDDIFKTIDDYNTDTPFKPYTGQMVADLSGSEQQARQLASKNLGSTGGLFDDAENMIKTGASATLAPEDVNYRTFDADRVRERYNPFEEDVIKSTGALFDEDLAGKRADLQSQQTLKGSYGGSRHGIAEGELMRGSALDKANMEAQLKYQGYGDAVSGDERESAGLFGADTFNANQKTDAAKSNIDNQYKGSQLLSGLAGDKQASWMKEVDLMSQLGATERDIENAKNLAERAKYDEQAADEWRRLQLKLQTQVGLLGATPMLVNNTGTANTTTKITDPMGSLSQLLQGLGSLASGGAGLFKPPV